MRKIPKPIDVGCRRQPFGHDSRPTHKKREPSAYCGRKPHTNAQRQRGGCLPLPACDINCPPLTGIANHAPPPETMMLPASLLPANHSTLPRRPSWDFIVRMGNREREKKGNESGVWPLSNLCVRERNRMERARDIGSVHAPPDEER